MNVDIVGEDPVTQHVVERLIKLYRKDIVIVNRLPARGGQIQDLAPKYNKIGSPIIMLTDLDAYDCPPSMINAWFKEKLSEDFLFRIACTETETWLMADREGFAKWLSIDIARIPGAKEMDRKNKRNVELAFKYKPSLYLMKDLAAHSTNEQLREMLTPREGAKKGPAYNQAIIPFIDNAWNVEAAMKNSYSLQNAVSRIAEFKL